MTISRFNAYRDAVMTVLVWVDEGLIHTVPILKSLLKVKIAVEPFPRSTVVAEVTFVTST